jgi:hypothetical protein
MRSTNPHATGTKAACIHVANVCRWARCELKDRCRSGAYALEDNLPVFKGLFEGWLNWDRVNAVFHGVVDGGKESLSTWHSKGRVLQFTCHLLITLERGELSFSNAFYECCDFFNLFWWEFYCVCCPIEDPAQDFLHMAPLSVTLL